MAKCIMVVDDEEDIRKTITLLLQKNGFKVVVAKDGSECLSMLKKIKPDLILMDIMMPGMKGKDLVKKIKGIKIVLISVVHISDAEREQITEATNVIDFIQKPFDVNELVQKVSDLVSL